jgi:predicted branched-subunit amino acid permease
MSRNELIVLDPDCTALAFAAFVCAMAFCWAIWVAGSVLGAVAGVFAAAAGALELDCATALREMLLMIAGVPPAA